MLRMVVLIMLMGVFRFIVLLVEVDLVEDLLVFVVWFVVVCVLEVVWCLFVFVLFCFLVLVCFVVLVVLDLFDLDLVLEEFLLVLEVLFL